jgi:integrase/recombinase XerC
MLRGWRQQQLSRNLAFSRVDGRERLLRAFQAAIRSYEHTIRTFCSYLTDGRYGWVDECERRFGTHPIQICFAWNTASHSSDFEGNPVRRALTKPELQRLFDLADDQVARARHAGRKGWLAAFRDATLFKVTYAWSLRRREVTMLDIHDFAPNPKAPEFHHVGVLRVRHGNATRGSPPKRRSVLTVMDWSVEVVEEWLGEVRPLLPHSDGSALWPSERALRIGLHDRLGLPKGLNLHCLRHSYVTHLIEAGYDPLFVQQQVGHEYASTLALYTSVSSDYKTTMVRRALDGEIARALGRRPGGGS